MKIQNVSKSTYAIPGGQVLPGQVVDLEVEGLDPKVKLLHVHYPRDWKVVGSEPEAKLAPVVAKVESLAKLEPVEKTSDGSELDEPKAESKPKGKAKS